MIGKLVAFCIEQKLLVGLGLVAAVGFGWWCTQVVPIDAIPDVGENQVIVLADWPGRSPKDIEDQVTYPLSVALQTVPGSRSVRGKSMFGFSFVQVTFDDGTDFYWARSRVAERLTAISGSLPEGVTPTLAPDATALGQIFYYVVEGPPGMDLAQLRSQQDYFIKYALQSVEGVAEVASIGGHVKQYQVEVDPEKLRYHRLRLRQVVAAIEDSNIDVGAKVIDHGGLEFLVRGKGFLGKGRTEEETVQQIEETVIEARDGIPIRVRDVAWVQMGPALRTGALDWNGNEAVGGIVAMRFGENPRDVIRRVQEKITALEQQMDGLRITGIYDRTELIDETIATLTDALVHETLITIMIMVAITLPAAVLMSFIAMKVFGVDANIMSLAGIAIAIGTMVDMGIIVLENVYDGLADWEQAGQPGGKRGRVQTLHRAACQVIPAVITAVSTTIVSFLPVFFLTGRDGRLFTPMAWTKTFALVASLIVAVVVVPMLCHMFLRSQRRGCLSGPLYALAVAVLFGATFYFLWGDSTEAIWEHWRGSHGLSWLPAAAPSAWSLTLGAAGLGALIGWWVAGERLRPLRENPISRFVLWLYAGRLQLALNHKAVMLAFPLLLFLTGLGAWFGFPRMLQPVERLATRLGAELNHVPGYVEFKHSFTGLKSSDWIALDEGSWFYMPSLYPAATFGQTFEVLQKQGVLIRQIPEVAQVLGKIGRAESALDPAPVTMIETYVMLRPRSEWREGRTSRQVWDEINAVAILPGVTPASALQPIEGRVVMLQAGIRATMAVRIYGESLEGLSQAALAVADQLKEHPAVLAGTVSPDIVLGKPYLEFEVDRQQAARYGMTTREVNEIIAAGLGGVDATVTVEGRERYAVQVRFDRQVREQIDQLARTSVVTASGDVVPLGELAASTTTWGPMGINSEDARLVAHVPFMPSGVLGPIETARSIEQSLRTARQEGQLVLGDENFELQMVGSFQNQVESNLRLMWIIPTVILINLLLHYLHFRNLALSLVVFSGIPVAAAGGMIAAAYMELQMNTAMWIGFIALFGLAADDGIVMATYIRDVLRRKRITSVADIRAGIYEAGLKRVRPCLMTTVTTLVALLPILLSDGRGADVARAMAIPIFGGMLIEPLTTFVVPTLYCGFLEFKFRMGWSEEFWQDEDEFESVRAS